MDQLIDQWIKEHIDGLIDTLINLGNNSPMHSFMFSCAIHSLAGRRAVGGGGRFQHRSLIREPR